MSLVHIAQAASTLLHVATLVFAAIGEMVSNNKRHLAVAYVKA